MTDERVLCTICARGGSTGVPNKNVRNVGGKPLIAHTIEDALQWGSYDDLVVSTDDDEIARVSREYGAPVPFERPAELATDEAAKIPVIQHALDYMEQETGEPYEYIVDLDPTAPLRRPQDIEECLETARQPDVTNVYTVCEADKNPYFDLVELDDEGYAHLSKQPAESVVRRQDAPSVYAISAAVYVYTREFLESASSVHSDRVRVVELPPIRAIDIDRPLDIEWVEFVMERLDTEI